MGMKEVKKGVWKEEGAIYGKPKTFQILCDFCGKKDTVEQSIINFSQIHIVCNSCGSYEKMG